MMIHALSKVTTAVLATMLVAAAPVLAQGPAPAPSPADSPSPPAASDDRAATVGAVQQLAAGLDIISFENRYRCTDGSYKWLWWNATPFRGQHLLYATARDITESKQAQEALCLAKDTAEGANYAKSQFLANMSHELRTPLNSVIGFSSILLKNKRKNLHEQELSYLRKIQDNGQHLLGLINDILDLSKVEAGRMELELAPVSLTVLIQDIIGLFESQTHDRDVTLHADLPASIASIEADAVKLKQVLINLIGNALKFTERGSVTVRVDVDPTTHHPTCIDVIDTGVGIPSDQLETIFHPFKQANTSTRRQYGGTGLGLAISHAMCKLMVWPLTVSSEVGQGSTFSIRLTTEAACPLPNAAVDASHAASPLSVRLAPPQKVLTPPPQHTDRVVLVIDDEADARQMLTQHIRKLGYQVMTAATGTQGLHLAKEVRPDLITLDLMMPEMSGWLVLQALKADPDLQMIPVVAISAVAGEHRGRLLGVLDYLDKPVTRSDLSAVFKRNVRSRQGKVLVVEDDGDTRCLIAAQLAEEGAESQMVANGQEALARLEGFVPDLIILDLMMPVMDGMAFLGLLQQEPRYCHIPVVIVTAKELTPQEVQYLAGQTAAIVQKGEYFMQHLQHMLQVTLQQFDHNHDGDPSLTAPSVDEEILLA